MKAANRTIAVLVVGVSAILALTGCIDNTPTPAPTSSNTPSTTPTPTPSSTPPPTPVSLPCNTLFTPQQVYDYNPNFVAQNAYKPAAGTDAATVAADKGMACGWVDETSGTVLAVGIAQPAVSVLSRLEASASGSSSPAEFAGGATGYFSVTAGVGELQIFTSKYWVVISSSDFAAVEDVQPTAQVVIGNLSGH